MGGIGERLALVGRMAPAVQGLRALDTREERMLAGTVSGLLYLTGAVAALAVLLLPGATIESPGIVVGCAAFGIVWGTACLVWVPWERGAGLLSHVSSLTGFPIVAVLMAITGGAESPFLLFLLFGVVFASCFYPSREALAYFAGTLAVLALPLLYDHGAFAAGYGRMLATYVPTISVVGGSLIAGRRVQRILGRQAAVLAAEQGSLRRVAMAVAAGSPPTAVFALVASEAVHLLEADASAVVKFDHADSALLVGVWSGENHRMEAGTRMPLLPGTELSRVLETQRPVRVDDFPPGDVSRAAEYGYRSTVCVPVHVSGRVWGAIAVASLEPGAWNRETERRLADFADLLTAAIADTEDRARLAAQASCDPLTGLPNHRALQARLRAEAARATRHGRPMALALVDIDNFKLVNDRVGHEVGDEILAELAARLKTVVRAEDLLARTGGDEFALLLPESDKQTAYAVLERARALVASEPFRHSVRLTISAGVCDLETGGDGDSIYRLADGALYWSKVHGRDVTWIYDPTVVRTLSAHERAEHLERSQALLGLRALARAIDAKDPSTREHSERVADLAARLAEASGWERRRVAKLREAALVHDVGKIGVPDAILLKPGRLEPTEYELVKEHAELGARIVGEVLSPEQVDWVRSHHERPDGLGYPAGVPAEKIPEGATLLAMADCWDVMTSTRSYSAPVPPEEALQECRGLVGRQFAAGALAALESLHAGGELTLSGPVTAAR